MTHALQVLHTLQWHHPGGRALLQLALAPTQDYHSYKHALLGGVEEDDTSPSGSPVRLQENTELLSVCGLTGTQQRVSRAMCILHTRQAHLWFIPDSLKSFS